MFARAHLVAQRPCLCDRSTHGYIPRLSAGVNRQILSALTCVWGMSTEAAGGFGSHSLTSDGLTLTFRVDHLLFPQG